LVDVFNGRDYEGKAPEDFIEMFVQYVAKARQK
jgi:hypothetical protein